jgi:xylulokinase
LALATTKKQLVKALLEGVTYEMAVNLRMLEKAGVSIKEFKATGGGARSATWMQIKADILDRPVVTLDISETACFGAAVLAGWASGQYATPEPVARSAARIQATFTPNAQTQAQYEKILHRYQRVYPAVKAIGRTEAQESFSVDPVRSRVNS